MESVQHNFQPIFGNRLASSQLQYDGGNEDDTQIWNEQNDYGSKNHNRRNSTEFRNASFIATATRSSSPQADGDESHLAPLVRRKIHLEQHRDQMPRFATAVLSARVLSTGRVGDELVKFDRARAVGQRIGRTL